MLSTIRRPVAGLAVLLTAALAVSACGDSAKSATGPSAAPSKSNSKVAAEVPSRVKAKGTLMVATDATYPPNEFIAPDGHTVIGWDPELIKALGAAMGLKVKVVNASFDSILPGLASGKYDIGMAGFTDTKEREKTVDFVTYFSAGTSLYVKTQGGPSISTLSDLCGRKVAVEKGTVQQDYATGQSKKCKAAGRLGVDVLTFPDQNGANLALSSGRAEVGMADSPPAAWLAKQSGGRLKVVGKPFGTAPYGVAIPKGTGMPQPVLDALKAVMANGAYDAILRKWGIQDGAIHDPAINGAHG
jgi:polar amino acid transport system substrate-binding protein